MHGVSIGKQEQSRAVRHGPGSGLHVSMWGADLTSLSCLSQYEVLASQVVLPQANVGGAVGGGADGAPQASAAAATIERARQSFAPDMGGWYSDPVSRNRLESVPPVPWAPTPLERARRFLKVHGRKLWWIHSLYALGIGTSVVFFAQRGYEHARWLAVTLSAAWLIGLVFFRVFSSRTGQVDQARVTNPVPFYALTYALKNLYQGMLFFLLPFYFKSTTFLSANGWFVGLLGACAIIATLDILFDQVVFRFRVLASIFHAVTLFGCMNLALPALLPSIRTLTALVIAAALTVIGFFSLRVRAEMIKDARTLVALGGALLVAVPAAYFGRRAIPPVPMYVAHGAVGPMVLDDGRLGMEVTRLHPAVIEKLLCVTDVVIPGGTGDHLLHVWRKNGVEVWRGADRAWFGPHQVVRLRSALRNIPKDLVGPWQVDVETDDGQLVGRTTFVVEE